MGYVKCKHMICTKLFFYSSETNRKKIIKEINALSRCLLKSFWVFFPRKYFALFFHTSPKLFWAGLNVFFWSKSFLAESKLFGHGSKNKIQYWKVVLGSGIILVLFQIYLVVQGSISFWMFMKKFQCLKYFWASRCIEH